MPKVSQEVPKIIQKSSKIEPWPPQKIEANSLQKQVRIQNRSWGATPSFFKAIISDFEASWLPRWFYIGGQDGAKIDKKSMQKKMKFWRPLGTSKNRKIFDFGGQHGGKLAPKSMPKSMLSSKGAFKQKPCFSFGKIRFFEIQRSKLGAKIDEISM